MHTKEINSRSWINEWMAQSTGWPKALAHDIDIFKIYILYKYNFYLRIM